MSVLYIDKLATVAAEAYYMLTFEVSGFVIEVVDKSKAIIKHGMCLNT